MSNPAIEEAYAKAGGRKRVQETLGVTKASLSDWIRSGRVPANRCVELEQLSGVSRRKLNPDFNWGPETAAIPTIAYTALKKKAVQYAQQPAVKAALAPDDSSIDNTSK